MSDTEVEWVPHKRETWPWRIGKLKRDVEGSVYLGYWTDGEPVMKPHPIKAGTTVKIVMVSRFGDVGITDKLEDEVGYMARVSLDDLEEQP